MAGQYDDAVLQAWVDAVRNNGVKNSMNKFVGDGVKTVYDINFAGGYLNKADILAYKVSPTNAKTDVVVTAVNDNKVTISAPVEAGWTLVIYRDTPKSFPLVDFADNSIINEKNLDTNFKQTVFGVAELLDRFDETVTFTLDAYAAAERAQNSANAASASEAAAAASAASALASANTASSAATTTTNDRVAVTALAGQAASNAMTAAASAGTAVQAANTAAGAAESALASSSSAATSALVAQNVGGVSWLPAGLTAPVVFAAGIYATATTTVMYNGKLYSAKASAVPFTTTGTFNPAQWDTITGVSRQELAAEYGSSLIGAATYAHLRAYTGSATRIQLGGRANYFDGCSGIVVMKDQVATKPDNDGTYFVDALGRGWGREINDGLVKAVWFGAKGDFNYTTQAGTDDTAALQAAADVVKDSGTLRYAGVPTTHPFSWKGLTLDLGTGFYLVTAPLWFGVNTITTSDYSKIVGRFTGNGAVIVGRTNGKPVVDMVGAFGVKGNGVTIFGTATNSPNIGVLLARSGTDAVNPSAGNHFFSDFHFAGHFTLGCVYNYGSEINHWSNCDFANSTGTSVYYGTANNARKAVTSDYATVATSLQSCYGDFFSTCTLNGKMSDLAGGLVVSESLSYGPSFDNSYLDSDFVPYFLFINGQGLSGTASRTQTPRVTKCTFEASNNPIVKLSGGAVVTSLTLAGNAMPVNNNNPHIVIDAGCTLSDADIQAFAGDTLNSPVLMNVLGNYYRRELQYFKLDDVYMNAYTALTADGTDKTIDLATQYAVPVTATHVRIKAEVKTAGTPSDAIRLTFKGGAATPAVQHFVCVPTGNYSQYFEAIVPVANGQLIYNGASALTLCRMLIRGYYI